MRCKTARRNQNGNAEAGAGQMLLHREYILTGYRDVMHWPALLFIATTITAAPFMTPDDADSTWKALLSIAGNWAGEGSGKPGQGLGEFSLAPELDGAVLVRHSKSDYPAANGKPAEHHRDLMVYYRRGAEVRSDYWDNEGHTISYVVQASPDGNRITLISDPAASAPRFRFTYMKLSADRMEVTFESAPPGKPDQFAMYVKGTVRRK